MLDQPLPPSPAPSSPSPAPSPGLAPGGMAIAVAISTATLGERAYTLDEVTVAVGDAVTRTNTDSVPHVFTWDAVGWHSGVGLPGGKFSVAFENAGTLPYHG